MWTTVGWIVFSVACRQSDAMKSYENSRFSHSVSHHVWCVTLSIHTCRNEDFPRISQGDVTKWVQPKSFTMKPTEHWLQRMKSGRLVCTETNQHTKLVTIKQISLCQSVAKKKLHGTLSTVIKCWYFNNINFKCWSAGCFSYNEANIT